MSADRRLIEFARRMRREPTPAEQAMWVLLRNRRLAGFRFRRQHTIGLYIADFYCANSAIVVKADGDAHMTPEAMEHDRVRGDYLEALGVLVLRFWNFDIAESKDDVLEHIFNTCHERDGTRRRTTPRRDRRPRF